MLSISYVVYSKKTGCMEIYTERTEMISTTIIIVTINDNNICKQQQTTTKGVSSQIFKFNDASNLQFLLPTSKKLRRHLPGENEEDFFLFYCYYYNCICFFKWCICVSFRLVTWRHRERLNEEE